MKKSFIFIALLILSESTDSQWVLDYQFNSTGSISVRGLSIVDSTYIWVTSVDSALTSNIYKRINGSNVLLNSSGIDRVNKLISIDSTSAYLGSYGQKLYYTSNSGNTWILRLNDSTVEYPFFDVSYSNPNVVISATFSLDSFYNKVYLSTNGGTNWVRQNIILPANSEVYDVTINDPQHIWVGINCYDLDCPDLRYYCTVNGGASWISKTFPLISNNVDMDAPVFKKNNAFGFVFAPGFNYYIYSSSNSGNNWSAPFLLVTGGSYYGIKLSNIDSTSIWYWSSQKKIFKTTNDGAVWSEMTIGVVEPDFIRTADFKRIGNKVYGWVGTNKGKLFKLSESINTIGITQLSTETPEFYTLHQNYPNPFNPSTKIRFEIPKNSLVKIIVFDATGKEVNTIIKQHLNAGTYETDFDASVIPSGVYFYKLETPAFTQTRKMVVIK